MVSLSNMSRSESEFTDEEVEDDHDSAPNVIEDSLSDDSDDGFIKKRSKKRAPILTSDSDTTEELNLSDPIKKSNNTHKTQPVVSQRKSFSERRESQLILSESEDDTQILHFPSTTESNNETFQTENFLERRESQLISSSEDETEKLTYPSCTENISPGVEKSTDNLDTLAKLNLSVASDEFHIEGEHKIINSTALDVGNKYDSKPSFRLSTCTKRSLNRSMDTPRIIKQIKESTTPNYTTPKAVEAPNFSDEDDVIEVSSDEEIIQNIPKTPINKVTINSKISKTPVITTVVKEDLQQPKPIMVPLRDYEIQNNKIKSLQNDIQKMTNLLKTVNLEHLPDKGFSIKHKQEALENMLVQEVTKLSRMVVTQEHLNEQSGTSQTKNRNILTWAEIEAKAGTVQPRTFGKQAMSTYNAQKAVTMDKLHELHGSLKTRPPETVLADDPKGLKVTLMEHQKHALAWMAWREQQKPSGGILADDMGLGKTLTMISLIMKTKEANENESEDSENEIESNKSSKPLGGTLVICPASLINQWSSELERRTKRGLLSYEMYHGPKRETKPKRLSKHDMVITTYAIINNECEKNGAVFQVKWRRIIIDEAHQIRNHKSQTSEAVCNLSAKSRWALTGTPVHNKEVDMYSLLKFLRLTPFNDLQVWKRWVTDKSSGGTERLHTVISSIMLRRTKVELVEKGSLNSLPERSWQLIPVQLTKSELDIYNRILIFSRTLFAQFLHQRAEKNQDERDQEFALKGQMNDNPNQEYFKMRQKLLHLNKVKDIKQHEILVLLLRLRQICCHPSLITGMLHEDMPDLGGDDDSHAAELDILEQLNNLTIDEDVHNPLANFQTNDQAAGLNEVARGLLNPSNPVFSKQRASSKIKMMLNVLKEKVLSNNDKGIVISQWPSFLHLIATHLKNENICYDQLDGTVVVSKRMEMVDNFNNPQHKMKVLLLSLTAGGVGLNLIGANHLFLLDLHWNPQLENQAQDRIYRVGQIKPVFIYKFMATDTIEKRILDLQEKKLEIANSMLTGTKQVIANKLSLQDLKMLFEM